MIRSWARALCSIASRARAGSLAAAPWVRRWAAQVAIARTGDCRSASTLARKSSFTRLGLLGRGAELALALERARELVLRALALVDVDAGADDSRGTRRSAE